MQKSVVYSREIPLGAQSLYEAMVEVIERMGDESRTSAVALSATIGKTPSTFSVPVDVAVTKRSPQDGAVNVFIKARSAAGLFPEFKGTLRANAMSGLRTNLEMKGKYRVPLGPIGATFNASGLKGVAEQSLRDFFERVVDQTVSTAREPASS